MEKNLNQISDENLDILLVIPPPVWTKMPHLGIAYLATFLKSKGIKVGLYDFNLKLYNSMPEHMRCYWQMDCLNSFSAMEINEKIYSYFQDKIRSLAEEILSTDVKIVGFSVNAISMFIANKIARLIKSKDSKRIIVFGGPAVFFKTQRIFIDHRFVDVVVAGEGERALFDIITRFKKGKKIRNNFNMLLERQSRFYNMPLVKGIENLDTIPHPTFIEFNLKEYNQGNDYKPVPMLLSRGCIGRCSYCIDRFMWSGYRYRSAEHIIQELRYHMDVNKVNVFEFNDLICNGNLDELSKLCDFIIGSGIKIDWVSYAVIRKDMGQELFDKLKRSGCSTLIYGLESGSDRILRKMRKFYTAKDAKRILKLTHEANIFTNINIIVGFPGETEEDFNDTIEFIYRNRENIDELTNISAFCLFFDAEVNHFRNKYGVILEKGLDPILFKDTNGLDRADRNRRLDKLVKVSEQLGIRKAIVNKPKLDPAALAEAERRLNK